MFTVLLQRRRFGPGKRSGQSQTCGTIPAKKLHRSAHPNRLVSGLKAHSDFDTSTSSSEEVLRRFEQFAHEIRPELHRYCARMTGSIVDGEDVLQETLSKAFTLLREGTEIRDLRAWIFRVAHNKSVDWTRDHARRFSDALDEYPEMVSPSSPLEDRDLAAMGLAVFMRLTAMQRGCVILKDVLGYTVEEIAEILESSISSVKGALHRGRATLHRLSLSGFSDAPRPANKEERQLLATYVECFNARDFDVLRSLLANAVKLEVVTISRAEGAGNVGSYFSRYGSTQDWLAKPGEVDGALAVLMFIANESVPRYFVRLEWEAGRIVAIRDFRYAHYVMCDANWNLL